MTDGEQHTEPEAAREGDINDDRQDPPTPPKADGEEAPLDGLAATPGDDAEGGEG